MKKVALVLALLCIMTAESSEIRTSLVKSEQFTRKDKCERWAAFAVELYRDRKNGIIVNVTPNLERFKQMVWDFAGTEDELKEQVMADCLFVRT